MPQWQLKVAANDHPIRFCGDWIFLKVILWLLEVSGSTRYLRELIVVDIIRWFNDLHRLSASGIFRSPNIPVWHPNRYSLCLCLLSPSWFQQASETGRYNVFLIIPASYTIIFPAYLLCLKQIFINQLKWRNGFKLFSAWNRRMGQARI